MEKIIIKKREIGKGFPAYIIAEMSANHAGSLAYAQIKLNNAANISLLTVPDMYTKPGCNATKARGNSMLFSSLHNSLKILYAIYTVRHP